MFYYSTISPGNVLASFHSQSSGAGSSPIAVDDNEWHHWAGVHDINANQTRIYIDGILRGTAGASTMIPRSDDFFLGHVAAGGSPLIGSLDEIRVSSIVRYTTNFDNSLPVRHRIDVNTIAYWRLDQKSGNTANDSSGNGRHGTLVGTPNPIWIKR